MVQDERTFTRGFGILEGVQAHQDRAPHGGPLDGSAYPQPRRSGRGVPRLLPPPGLPDLPGLDRRLDRLPRPAHHQRGLAGHRAGRQAAPRHRLRRLPLRRLGVGRPGHRPGHLDPHPLDPRRRGLDRGRRHPLSQAWRQGRLRRHLPRRRALVEEAQDLPVRPELGRAGHRRADPVASPTATTACRCSGGSTARRDRTATRPAPRPPRCWRGSWPRPTPSGPSGWSATAPTSTRRCCRAGRRTSR